MLPVLDCIVHKKSISRSIVTSLFFKTSQKNTGIISPNNKLFVWRQRKNRQQSASLTVEAALVLPAFFLFFYMVWQAFLLLSFQVSVCRSITEVILTKGGLGYVERRSGEDALSFLYYPVFWNGLPKDSRAEGMLLLLKEDGDALEVTVRYEFVCKGALFPEQHFPIQQEFRFVPYVGEYEKNKQKEEKETESASEDAVVYVTESGTVYHKSKTCTYLYIQLAAVPYEKVGTMRNLYGEKYTACELCIKRGGLTKVYTAASGTKYHRTTECSALKRSILEKKQNEVSLPPCTKCVTEEKE